MGNKNLTGTLSVSSAPHIVTKMDTARTMQNVLIALIPALVMSIVNFGARALILTIVCVLSCVFFEWAYEKMMKKKITIQDYTACVTGALLAFNLPANFPYWMAIIGSFTAIVVVKQLYGGLGKNFANPAIVGRIVLLLSFTTQMTTWPVSKLAGIDATTGPTPLGILDENVDKLPVLKDLFLGFTGGAMGEMSAIALIIGGVYLIARKIISPIIPVSFIGTVFVVSLIYYGAKGGYTVDGQTYSVMYMSLYQLFAGGLMLGAFFCATDYVTSPIMAKGKVIFGIGCGLVTMVIRLACAYPEGVSFAILFMNMLTPLIDRVVVRNFYKKLYGGAGK